MQMTSREFNQDLGRAKRESLREPIIITDRGAPKHVLMSYEEYQLIIQKKPQSAYEWLCSLEHADVSDIELDIPPRSTAQRSAVEFD
ncbi:type II toxin-antitoxin system Phd/YefM family antitoxin [Leucothrix mucor]|jgi:prevent-host-death family protein|uniref:type II toxin-antitoxin system Phd/YefM family antitoxin n=1 Tax=Leucothrix mucor TaxID=45248 RepID=UPI0003B2E83F|nr:type II toxin-antitoxin system Phd/YefM family antitoxin [Leucothrix mucor]